MSRAAAAVPARIRRVLPTFRAIPVSRLPGRLPGRFPVRGPVRALPAGRLACFFLLPAGTGLPLASSRLRLPGPVRLRCCFRPVRPAEGRPARSVCLPSIMLCHRFPTPEGFLFLFCSPRPRACPKAPRGPGVSASCPSWFLRPLFLKIRKRLLHNVYYAVT